MLPLVHAHVLKQVPVVREQSGKPVRRSGPELVLQRGDEPGILLWHGHAWHQVLQNEHEMELLQVQVSEQVVAQEIVQELMQAWAYVSKQR
jgi:hypothetical protein